MRRVGVYKEKTCVVCEEVFVPTSGKQRACTNCSHTYWKQSHARQARERNRKKKLNAIEYLGGKCKHCGGVFHPAVYEIHHLNPEEKEYDFNELANQKWEKLTNELDKCILLCANCHRLEHAKQREGV